MKCNDGVIFSVITVCFNEENSIRKTIESVLKQDFDLYEYIICDGGSTDGTLAIAESYRDSFEKKGVDYQIHSERDGGLYFGMNIGIALAKGEYLNFLNAGDEFHDATTLSMMNQTIQKNSADIFYGDIIKIERKYGKYEAGSISKIREGMSICHQAMFIKAGLLRLHPYDTRYRIVADYEFTLSMWQQGKKFFHVDAPVANFSAGGLSTTQFERIAEEYAEIQSNAKIDSNYRKKLNDTRRNYELEKKKKKLPQWIWELYNRMHGRKKYE